MTKLKLYLLLISTLLVSCGKEPVPTTAEAAINVNTNGKENIRMRNREIRLDIINALTGHEIEHWINEDGSIGFYSKDAERVDAIGYAAIGAYAARN
jgi:hypothetical protein